MSRTIVIGGGASGMLAAYYSAVNGNETILLEQNEKLGKKIYITGKGRCNLSNYVEPSFFLENVVTNKKFLIGAINSFSPSKLMELFENNGLKLKVERGKRVFPVSDKSNDVNKCLEKMLIKSGVNIHLNEKVIDIKTDNQIITGIVTDKKVYSAENVIIATGGKSYPSTGSRGDGYEFAKKLGHTVIEPKPALTGLNIKGDFCKRLSGLTLKNVGFVAKRGEKLIFSETGELLFTDYGVSGPLVLTVSSLIARDFPYNIKLDIDLKVGLTKEQLNNRILRDFEEFKGKNIEFSLQKLLPSAIIKEVIILSKINSCKKNSEITKEERENLIDVIKNFPLKLVSSRDFNEAIITNGGISVKEINPKTMESKIIKGLYFTGEIIDVDAFTGGFNLQIAFSTGYVAGNNCK